MPPLICLSPIILDQSFPRNENELRRAATALGEVARLVEDGKAEFLITEALQDFLVLFDCGAGDRPYALIQDLFGLLDTWVLTMPDGVVRIDVNDAHAQEPHPIPESCGDAGLVDIWSQELGKLLAVHDAEATEGFFIGVACESAFSGGPVGHYRPPPRRAFPLVGPADVANLEDASEWITLPDAQAIEVSFAAAKQNVHLLGAAEVRRPSSGSHYIVKFPGRRPWPLDPNVDPVAERFIRQLIHLTGYPLSVIKTVLVSGRRPEKRRRLEGRRG